MTYFTVHERLEKRDRAWNWNMASTFHSLVHLYQGKS